MKIIDKYIFKQLFGPFIFSATAFVSVSIGALFFSAFDLVGKYSAHWSFSLELVALRLPMVIVPVIPMSMLLAALLTFGKLSASSEITAMKSGGLSFARIMAPVVMLGVLVSLASFATSQFITPWANKQYDYIERALIKKETSGNTSLQENIIIKGAVAADRGAYALLYAKEYDSTTNRLNNVTAEEFENGALARIISAKTASYQNNAWLLEKCSIFSTKGDSGFSNAATHSVPIAKRPELVIADQKDPEQLGFGELWEVYSTLRAENSPDYRKFETEVFNRAAIPFAGVIFALVGAPLGMQSNRSSSSVGLGISLIVILLYYAIYSFMLTLGKGAVVNGFVAAWTPNVVGMIFGAFLIYKMRKK